MSGVFYPQVAVTLNILWEDFKLSSEAISAKSSILDVLARSVRVNINDYAHADTFEVELDYKCFPFDPRLIRSCGVTIYMQNLEKLYDKSGKQVQIKPLDSNVIFQGFADEDSLTFDDDRGTVRLEGRDFTSLFLDRTYPSGTINLEKPADEVIREIVEALPENVKYVYKGVEQSKIQIVNNVKDEKGNLVQLPTLASFFSNKDQSSGRKNVRKNESYWEVIQDIVGRAGLIAYIEIDKLILSKPRVLYNKKKTAYFVYGKNVRNLEFKRKLGRRKNFNIVVRSLNIESKDILEAKIPAEATAEWSNLVGVPNKEVKVEKMGADGKPIPEENAQPAPYMAFSVPNVTSKDHLIEIAQQIYEEISRQEIEGSLETRDMHTWFFNAETKVASESCFDLLKLRIGTPISIEIDKSDMMELNRMSSIDARKRFLIKQGYPASSADTISRNIARISTPFYTKGVEFTMDQDQGFTMKIEFINFIETTNKGFGK